MSDRYKVYDSWMPHFITSTVVGWADALSRPDYKDIIVDSLKHCQEHKGLILHAWVIMSNHIHLIVSADNDVVLSDIIRDFKRFTSKNLVAAISDNPQESRREWLLNMFKYAAGSDNDKYQFWKQDYHPITLDKELIGKQKLDYLHENPVRAGIVWEPQHYKYSSASDYYEQKPGLLPLVMF